MAHVSEARILIVDDEAANLDLLESLLHEEGYTNIERACDGRDVMERAAATPPDLVLLDLHMPHLDGFEVMRQLKESAPSDRFVPILVLTADVTPEAKQRALAGGATDFVTKPIDAVEVGLRIHNLLEIRRLHVEQARARAEAERSAAENARLFEEARQATLARDEMLGIVAHDLRNPLNTISLAAQMLLERLRPDERPLERRQAEIIGRAVSGMDRLIQDLLDVKRIEGGRFALELGPVDLRTVLDEAIEILRPIAAARQLALDVNLVDGAHSVRADASRVQQVLSNLVGNAIKFTPPGGHIDIGVAQSGDEVAVRVRDTGIGIAAEEIPHIFSRFWQRRHTDRRGIGLGLAIARGIVEAHGGRIWVESRPGVGSQFVFTLTSADVEPKQQGEPTELDVGLAAGA